MEEFEYVHVVLGDLDRVILFNMIYNHKHLAFFELPWFKLHDPEVDWKKASNRKFLEKPHMTSRSNSSPKYLYIKNKYLYLQ